MTRYGIEVLKAGWYATEGRARTRVLGVGRRLGYGLAAFVVIGLASNAVFIQLLGFEPPH